MIIIIEDEPMRAEMIDIILQNLKHKTIGSFGELLLIPDEDLKVTKCIVSDMYLGKNRTAYDVKKYILEKNLNMHIILMTEKEHKNEYKKDFTEVIYKPLSNKTLIECCKKYL